MSGCAAGSYGASSGASKPTRMITPSRINATREERWRSNPRTVRPSGDSRGRAVSVATESGVGPGIEQVGDEAGDSDHDASDYHAADNERIIASADRVDYRVSHARPGENPLDEKGPREE